MEILHLKNRTRNGHSELMCLLIYTKQGVDTLITILFTSSKHEKDSQKSTKICPAKHAYQLLEGDSRFTYMAFHHTMQFYYKSKL